VSPVTSSPRLGAIGFAERVDASFVELIGWKPTRMVAIDADRHAGPLASDADLAPISVVEYTEAEADRVAMELALHFVDFKAKNPDLVWCNGPYAACMRDENGRRYCWIGHTEKPGTRVMKVTVVTEIPEGAVVPSEEGMAALVALRKKSGYTTREVHGNLRRGRDGALLIQGDASYENPKPNA
jgi:hypothetical protein